MISAERNFTTAPWSLSVRYTRRLLMEHFFPSLLAVFIACQSAWAGADTGTESGTSASLREVRVQLKWAHQFQFAGHYAAIHNGYYRDAGLDVTLIEYNSSMTPINQLLGGRVDFAVADSGALIYRSTGVPLVALAAIFQHSPSILISRADTGIRELSDLKDKRAMLAGGYMNAELMAMLSNAGIHSDEIRVLPTDTSINALIDGQTDAYNGYTTNEPYALSQQGVPFITFQPRDYGVDFYGDILITTETMVKNDPQLVRAFRDATLKGWVYAVEHPEDVVDLILDQYNTQNKTRDHLLFEAREAIKLILPGVVPIGYMNEERWRRIETVFEQQDILARNVDMQKFVYQTDETSALLKILYQYRVQISAGVILLLGILMLFHILRLRTQINVRTKELNNAKLRAESEARTDALTGLPNRHYFFEELARDIAKAQRHGIPLSVISVDIDFFKHINDNYGHAAGDEALRFAGDIFRVYTRAGDIAARIGGEEFAMACLNTTSGEVHELAERLRREMEQTNISYAAQPFHITVSIGIAMHESGDNVDQLLQKADTALYQAKQAGRNKVCEWNPQLENSDA